MIDYSNIGKQVIYDKSHDNIEDYVLGTIIGCYIGEDETYYTVSIESQGKVIKVFDDSLVTIIDSGGHSVETEVLTFEATSPGQNLVVTKQSDKLPFAIVISTGTVGAAVGDFQLGEMIECRLLPTGVDQSVDAKACGLGGGSYRNAANGNLSGQNYIEMESGLAYAAFSVNQLNGNVTVLRAATNAQWTVGVTYTVTLYYLS